MRCDELHDNYCKSNEEETELINIGRTGPLGTDLRALPYHSPDSEVTHVGFKIDRSSVQCDADVDRWQKNNVQAKVYDKIL